jgi:hypothetical protein
MQKLKVQKQTLSDTTTEPGLDDSAHARGVDQQPIETMSLMELRPADIARRIHPSLLPDYIVCAFLWQFPSAEKKQPGYSDVMKQFDVIDDRKLLASPV